jgi:hypothetical protein
MINLNIFKSNVLENCDISDARHAGLYSICGLALRLRDLYKWEQRLDPWQEHDSSRVLHWIGEKEAIWERITKRPFVPLTMNGKAFDPFDTAAINDKLAPHGFLYGAGYAYRLKPSFFLARIEKINTIGHHTVYCLKEELARDLLTLPALTQDGSILLRQDSARLFLWDQLLFLKRSGVPALEFALSRLGINDRQPATLQAAFEDIFNAIRNNYIYHEVGELEDRVIDPELWREIIGRFPNSPVELLARAVKDFLADTGPGGTLSHIVRHRNSAALGFYVAFIDGLLRTLYVGLRSAFQRFEKSGDWASIEEVLESGRQLAIDYAGSIVDRYRRGSAKGDDSGTRDAITALIPNT